MPRSMKDFIETREAGGATDIRVNVPVFLPGYSPIGNVSTDGDVASGLLATLYSIPNQLYRVIRRTMDRSRNPDQSVLQAAKFRNFEVVFTSIEVQYCPASPLLSKAQPAVATLPLSETAVVFHTVANEMSELTIATDLWHVHPEYAGDVRWELRRIADEHPDYTITFESS